MTAIIIKFASKKTKKGYIIMKKILAFVLAAAMISAASVAGTIAYLTDEETVINVMTLGNVQITLNEKDRNGDPFVQNQKLLPAIPDGNGGYENYIDKIVTVTNDGTEDAYVRAFVAVPKVTIGGNITDEVLVWDKYAGNDNQWTWDTPFEANIGGTDYLVHVATLNGELSPKNTTVPNLLGLYLDPKVDYNGSSYTYNGEVVSGLSANMQILVAAQAVQTEGWGNDSTKALDTAFYPPNANNHPWVDGFTAPVAVDSQDELDKAIADGKTTIVLEGGTYHMPAAAKGKTLTFIGTNDPIIEVVPGGQGEANGQLDYNLDGSTVTFNDVTIKTNSQLYAGYARLSATYNNCVIQNTYNLSTGTSEFNNCEFNITNEYLRVAGASSAKFNNCTFNTDGRAILVYQDGTNVAQTVTVKDCTFNATATATTWNGIDVAAVSIDGSQGGTYVVNLEGNNVVDSDFNGLYQIKAQMDPSNVTINM